MRQAPHEHAGKRESVEGKTLARLLSSCFQSSCGKEMNPAASQRRREVGCL